MSLFDDESLDWSDGDPLQRDVLDAAREDVPPAGAREKMFAALDLAPAASQVRAFSWRALGGRALYPLGAALVIGAGAAAFSGMSANAPPRSDSRTVRAVDSVVATAAASSGEPAEPAVVPSAASPSAEPDVNPPVHRSPRMARKSVTTTVASSERPLESTLGREIARMREARAALAANDAERTLLLLDAYDAEFTEGAFSVEVAVIRIEALARSGRVREARLLGDRFLTQHPRGLFANRVAVILRGLTSAE
ncbi:hypothetical protein AKJ09_02306 [Labilithrix luteola]|uniref:Uncharacterized protein n=1 Tax=Labilithrix luteola TaxID=1391654 RepID=A0A0K1PQ39_9BACT|nr:hypothetical protein [Labilithrix luteola]AKU95642.1 hypothetical protein AKJ09_02306 [Labilithrix luteola]